MKKLLVLAAATTAVVSSASAGMDIGFGISSVTFGGKSLNATGNTISKRDLSTTVFAPDVMLGYTFVSGKYSIGLEAFGQFGGGKATYESNSPDHYSLTRKPAYGAVAKFGVMVAQQSTIYLQGGAKFGRFIATTSAYSAANAPLVKKTFKKTGWVAGMGIKQGLSDVVSLDLSYSYVSYGKITVPPATVGAFVPTWGKTTKHLKEQNVRLGVTYGINM